MNIWQEQAVVDPFLPLRVLLDPVRIDLTGRVDVFLAPRPRGPPILHPPAPPPAVASHTEDEHSPDEGQDPSPPAVYSSTSSSSWSITREASRVLRALGDYETQQHNYRAQLEALTTSAITELLAKCRFHRMRFAWFRGQDVSAQTCILA